jgi:hypothetical protein
MRPPAAVRFLITHGDTLIQFRVPKQTAPSGPSISVNLSSRHQSRPKVAEMLY